MPCPLCGEPASRPSWMGSCAYRGREYGYHECVGCRSLFCQPMPHDDTLRLMYGVDYATAVGTHDPTVADPKEPGRVIGWLKKLGRGAFLDYGCGAGPLLTAARGLGWEALGVELDEEVARRTAGQTGARVVSDPARLADNGPPADVLHLGDVIEHLTALDRQMPEILRLLKPGGVVLAQGPLEANPNLFTSTLKLARSVRRPRAAEMAPYHVLLATARGQQGFFKRFGLSELEFVVSEVCWPAPSRLGAGDLLRPKAVGMFALRKASQLVSAVRPKALGNRYFYAGRYGAA